MPLGRFCCPAITDVEILLNPPVISNISGYFSLDFIYIFEVPKGIYFFFDNTFPVVFCLFAPDVMKEVHRFR